MIVKNILMMDGKLKIKKTDIKLLGFGEVI